MIICPVLAAETPVLRVLSPASVNAGASFEVSVLIEHNPGVAIAIIDLKYDSSAFDYVEVSKGSLFTGSIDARDRDFSGYHATRVMLTSLDAVTGDGTLFTVRLRAKANAASDMYPFEILYTSGNIVGGSYNAINPVTIPTNVSVRSGPVFTDGNGNLIDSLSADALVTTLAYRNKSLNIEKLTMYVGIFTNEGKLAYLGSGQKEIIAGQTVQFSVRLDLPTNADGSFAEKGYYANVFLMETDTYIPVSTQYIFK